MFPANSKFNPIFFNKTMGGFNAYTLLRWIKEKASNPVDVPDFINPDPFAPQLPVAPPAKDPAGVSHDGEGGVGMVTDKQREFADTRPAPVRQKPNPKNKAKAKIDDVMKELNDLRKGMKKDGSKDEL